MPDHSRYDLDYRPRSYWVFRDHLQKALATIKGTLRRETAGRILKGEPTMSMDPYTFDESLTPAERYKRMAFGPEFASGEFLPELQPFEVLIARVDYRSVLSDIVEVRAKRVDGRILYGILDDFTDKGQAYVTWNPSSSEKPLTMRELIQLMDTASKQPDHDPDGWFTGLVQGPVKHVYSSVAFHSDPRFTVEKERGFTTVTSAFYPELSSWYEDVDSELCEEFKRKAAQADRKKKIKKSETAETSALMNQLDEMAALQRDVQSWHTEMNRKNMNRKKLRDTGKEHRGDYGIRESIQKPQTIEEVVEAIRYQRSRKLPAGYGGICGAIVKGLKKRYIEMSGDMDLDPELSGEELYSYFDNKFGWTEEENKIADRQKKLDDINTGFRIRMILGTLAQGMPPAGYKDELRKLGLYSTYREELQLLGWSEDRITAFLNGLGNYH